MQGTDHLAVFGDSWTAGFGLAQNESPYGQLLSQSLEIKNYYNGGLCGTSVSRLLLQLFDYTALHKTVKNHIVVFFITSPGRSMVIDNKNKIIDINRKPANSQTALDDVYYNYFNSEFMEQFELTRNILALQQFCSQTQIQDYYIVGWNDLQFDCVGINKQKIYPKSCVQLFGYPDQKDYIKDLPNQYILSCRHPNQQGHTLIADVLYNWIKHDLVH
jgi:hypothetical protein